MQPRGIVKRIIPEENLELLVKQDFRIKLGDIPAIIHRKKSDREGSHADSFRTRLEK